MRWLSLDSWRRSKPKAKRGRGKKARTSWRERLPGRRSLLVLAALAPLGGLTWLALSGWFGLQFERAVEAGYSLSIDAGLAVDDVLVIGRQRTDRGRLLDALQVERGTPLLAFDPHAAKVRLEVLPWVKTATVERRLPGLVFVELSEREPLAIWQRDGAHAVIDQAGGIISGAKPAAFTGLPLVVGEDAPLHAKALLSMLDSEPDLGAQVEAAVRVGKRRWNLRMKSGIDVHLPEADTAAAWAQLADIERRHGVLERNVSAIDLRLPDRLIVRALPGITPRRRPDVDGKDT